MCHTGSPITAWIMVHEFRHLDRPLSHWTLLSVLAKLQWEQPFVSLTSQHNKTSEEDPLRVETRQDIVFTCLYTIAVLMFCCVLSYIRCNLYIVILCHAATHVLVMYPIPNFSLWHFYMWIKYYIFFYYIELIFSNWAAKKPHLGKPSLLSIQGWAAYFSPLHVICPF